MGNAEIVESILAHHGVKGMKWGVRKEPTSSGSTPKGLEQYPKSQASSMNNVATKMEKAYGFKIDEFALFTNPQDHFTETEGRNYLAMVASKSKGDKRNVIHVSPQANYKSTLDSAEKMGWFPPSGGHSVEANITHEAAHGLFHSNDASGKGVIQKKDVLIAPLRESAWNKAEQQARKDGDVSKRLSSSQQDRFEAHYQMASKVSKYSHSSPFIEEHEAELFTAYHWSPNPPKFVDAFMNDIHSSIGKEVKPFSGRRVSLAS
jgi:hypothetical protein